MNITLQPRQPPLTLGLSVALDEADVAAAFMVADPDEQLFYDLWGPGQTPALSHADQIRRVARVVELAEQARNLGLAAGSPEPK